LGVIDEEYIKKAKDPRAIAGRKINIQSEEVINLAGFLRDIGKNLAATLN
jgi:hypothetical protein